MKMKLRRLVCGVLAAVMAVSMAGCSKQSDTGQSDSRDTWSDGDWETVEYSQQVDAADASMRLFVNYVRGAGGSPYLETDGCSFMLPEVATTCAVRFNPETVTIDDICCLLGDNGYKGLRHSFHYVPRYSSDQMGMEEQWSINEPVSVSIIRRQDGTLVSFSVKPPETEPDMDLWNRLQGWTTDGYGYSWYICRDGMEPKVKNGYVWQYFPDKNEFSIRMQNEPEFEDSNNVNSYKTARARFDELFAGHDFLKKIFGDWLLLPEEADIASGAMKLDDRRTVMLEYIRDYTQMTRGSEIVKDGYIKALAEYINGEYVADFAVPRESRHWREVSVLLDTSAETGDRISLLPAEKWEYFAKSEREAKAWLKNKLEELQCVDFQWNSGQSWDFGKMAGDSQEGEGYGFATLFPELKGLQCEISAGVYDRDGKWGVELRVEY